MNKFEKQMMRKATEVMDIHPGWRKQSEIREKYKFQEENPFWDEREDSLSENDIERRPCTKEEKEELDRNIERLGDLFSDADFFWQLDGALNVSLYRGEYIGVHKDIDLSIDFREVEKVEPFLGKNGLGMFLSSGHGTESNRKRIFERIGAKQLKNNFQGLQLMIFAIDEKGAIKYGKEGFGIDAHIIKWNLADEPLGNYDTSIPKEWLNPKVIDFHGRKINCSHPALAAFHKLFFTRAYDDNDLKLLAQSGKLTKDDVYFIEQTFDKHIKYIQEKIRAYAYRNFSQINVAQTKQEIFDILINDELVNQKKDPETQKFFNNLTEKIISINNRTIENIYGTIFATTPVSKLLSKRDSRLAILRDNIPK